ncbi:MAG: cytochrome P450 [Rhodococcus sp. (in: high G+C Gram-positive bacteria)]|nr:MAG: cytochrome P450 [Rhodococcus sp. (in: high G+C Gram-positive bacteria)]
MPTDQLTDAPFLNLADPTFSVQSDAVRQAREASWFAHTSYGLAVLRYDEVSKLMKDRRLRQGSWAWPAHNGVHDGPFAHWWTSALLNLEGDDHHRLRRLMNPAFSPKLIGGLVPRFQALANELIDDFHERGRCDFASEFAEPYAARVIAIMLGIPEGEWKKIAAWSNDIGLALGVTLAQDLAKVEAALEGLYEYADELIADRRTNPGDDFVSRLVLAERDGEHLSHDELRVSLVLLIFGGMDPTVTWVTREALEDFEYQGLEIKAGTTIHLLSESAGTDPRVIEGEPFDLTAQRAPHFGFGGGAHHCLGHFVARSDMSEALPLLAQRLKNPTIDGIATWLPLSGNTGPIFLPIAFERG